MSQDLCWTVWPFQEAREVLSMKALVSPSWDRKGESRMRRQKEKVGWGGRTPNSDNHLTRKDRNFWWRLNYALGKPQGGACFKVQVEQVGGTVDKINGKENLHEAVWDNNHCKHFYLAKKAPMCSSPLRGAFGYNSITPTARELPSWIWWSDQGDPTRMCTDPPASHQELCVHNDHPHQKPS